MFAKRVIQLSLISMLVLASLAATHPAKAWSSYCGGSYVVQRGDWLGKIASNCGITLRELYAANPWVRYERYIYPGQVLAMPGGYNDGGPGGYCGPSADYYGGYWVVCRGDTLGIIARYYGVGWRYLQSRNGIYNANLIYPGQVIRP